MEKVDSFVRGAEHTNLYFTAIFEDKDIISLNKKLDEIEFSKRVVTELIEIRKKQLECNELSAVLKPLCIN